MIIFFLFVFWPVVKGFHFSLLEWGLRGPTAFVGLDNFRHMFDDVVFKTALINTFIYTFTTVPISIVIALFLALLLNRKIRFKIFFRSVIFFPVITSLVIVGFMWKYMFATEYGVINYVMTLFGGSKIEWLSDPVLAFGVVIMTSVWQSVGMGMVIYLAGLQGIPEQLYESSRIDGATESQQLIRITLPLLKPTTLFILVIQMIRSFRVFEQVYVLTQGGPGYSTQVMVYYIYRQAFQNYNMGVASAAAVVFFLIVLIFTVLQMKLLGQKVEY